MALLPNAKLLRSLLLTALLGGVWLAAASIGNPARAQTVAKPAEAAPQAVPGFWDPRRRPDRPDLSRITAIRFLTVTDLPPVNFPGAPGHPARLHLDLSR